MYVPYFITRMSGTSMVFAKIRQVPQAAGPEIVLAGRSNAGKSTLLNEILGALVAEF